MMEPVSSAIYETLMRQAIANGRAATRTVDGMEKAGSIHDGASRQVVTDAPREEEEETRHRPLPRSVSPGKLKLVWTNTAMTKATGRRTSRAALAMIVK